MKKDVYEHLAKTFLEKKEKKKTDHRQIWIFATIIVFSCFLIILQINNLLSKRNVFSKSLFVIQDKTPVEIDFDFSTIGDNKVRAISFNLKGINLKDYKYLSLNARSSGENTLVSALKIQMENSLRENDSEYIPGIDLEWRKFTVPLTNFEKIKDWSSVKALTFVVEEWNVGVKKDKIYIDDVKFLCELENNKLK